MRRDPPRGLAPFGTTTYITRSHGHLVWDTLYGLDGQVCPQPQAV